jgi:peptide chain release factor 1
MADNMILDRLEGVKSRFIEVGELLTQPNILSDMKKYVKLNREYKDLQPIVESYERYKLTLSNLASAKKLLSTEKDEEMRDMAKAEIDELTSHLPEMEEEIKLLIIPADPEDDKNAVMEIRAGTGGDEASIFAGDLFRMYSKFFETKGWKVEVNNISEGTAGG